MTSVDEGLLPEPQVQSMFNRIARRYDLMNAVMTAGLHERWRRRAVDSAAVTAGDTVLDLATGTGDMALELARRVGPDGKIVGADFADEMLVIAREKLAKKHPNLPVTFEPGNAMALTYGDNTFDALTVGFGVRNFADLDQGLAEMVRVVRPGGRVVILEIATPTRPPLSWFYSLWFDHLVPFFGRFADKNSAYTYLPRSVARFVTPAELAAKLQDAGTTEVHFVKLAGGIITIHRGTVV